MHVVAEHIRQTEDIAGTERWLLTLIEVMPQMIWRAVSAGSWTWSSPQWRRYTGLSSEESSGFGWLQAIHPDDREIAREAWQRAHALGEFHADLRVRSNSGSFKWFQTRGEPVRDGAQSIVEWIGTSTDIDDLRQLQSEQRVLVAELQHRTRNLIAVIHSVFLQTLRKSDSLNGFRDSFEERLSALSRVQGLLSTAEHKPITIRHLLELELHALADGHIIDQVKLIGPETIVRNTTVQTLALAVHELSTNAIKHGALSQYSGRLTVEWEDYFADGHQWLRLKWRETGVIVDKRPTEHAAGYGRVLIEQALPQQLGAHTELEFGADFMQCIIVFPKAGLDSEKMNG